MNENIQKNIKIMSDMDKELNKNKKLRKQMDNSFLYPNEM